MAEYTARLATRLDPAVDRRLRMLKLARGGCLCAVLTEVLDKALPSAEALSQDLIEAKGGTTDDDQS